MTSAIRRAETFGEFDDYLCWTATSVCDQSYEVYKACRGTPNRPSRLKYLRSSQQFCARLDEAVRHFLGRGASDPTFRRSALDQFSDADIRRAIAEIGAIHHENRHIQDVFGTPAGLSVVFGFWDCVLRFLRTTGKMKRQGKSWRLPLPVRAGTETTALLAIRAHLVTRELYDASFLPCRVETGLRGFVRKDQIGLVGQGIGKYAVVFHFEAGDSPPGESGPSGASASCSVAMPLGFEALLEGAARPLECATLIAQGFPPATVVSVLQPQLIARVQSASLQEAIDRFPQEVLPYQTTEEAIRTLLAERGLELHQLHPTLLLKLHDVVLLENELVISDMDGSVLADIPDFGAALKNAIDRHPDGALQVGEVVASPEGAESLARWVSTLLDITAADLRSEPDAEEMTFTQAMVMFWRKHLAAKVALPMLHKRSRLNDDPALDQIMQKLLSEALPDVEAHMEGRLHVFDGQTKASFLMSAFLIEILRQVFDGGSVIRCPHRLESLPFADSTSNFAQEGSCQRWMELGCGKFDQNKPEQWTPECLFERVLSDCGLRRGNG